MNRDKFLKELDFLLSDISEEERLEALLFYQDYFDEAGKENEERVLLELESPEKVAAIIKDSINGRFEENITSSEEGFTNKQYERVYEVQKVNPSHSIFDRFNDLSSGNKLLLVFLILFCLLPITALFMDAFGLGISLAVSILVLIFGAWIITFILFVLGVVGIVVGVLRGFTSLPIGFILVGSGIILIALSKLTSKLAMIIFDTIKKLFSKVQSAHKEGEV